MSKDNLRREKEIKKMSKDNLRREKEIKNMSKDNFKKIEKDMKRCIKTIQKERKT